MRPICFYQCVLVRIVTGVGFIGILSACGGGASTTVTPSVASSGGVTTPSQKFDPSTVHVTNIPLPKNLDTEILSVDNNGAAFFGSPNVYCTSVCGTGEPTPGLWRYSAGTLRQTLPRGPYFDPVFGCFDSIGDPIGICSLGNVEALNASDFSSVIWASDYTVDAGVLQGSQLEWGSGPTATTPPAMYDHDFFPHQAEIVSIVLAANGQMWLGGNANGGPALYPASVPTACQSGCDQFLVTNGPNGNVWAMTHLSGSTFFEFTPSGSLVKTYAIPDHVERIAGTPQAVWFTDPSHGAVGKIDKNGKVTEYTGLSSPFDITEAADESIWFTDGGGVGRIDDSGHINQFSLPFSNAVSIAATRPGCALNVIWVGTKLSGSSRTSAGQADLAEITFGS